MILTTPTGFVESTADVMAALLRTAATANGRGAAASCSALEPVERCLRDMVRSTQRTTHPKCDAPEHEQHPLTDPRLFALWTACDQEPVYTPHPDGEQARFLARLAMDRSGYLDPGKVLLTLTCLALRDRVTELRRQEGALAAEREQMRSQTVELGELRAGVDELRALVEGANQQRVALASELNVATSQLQQEREIVEFLRTVTGEDREPNGNTAVAVAKAPRRTKIEGETGIYETSWGALEIVYKADGKQHYETVDGDVTEARALREQRIAEARGSDGEATEA